MATIGVPTATVWPASASSSTTVAREGAWQLDHGLLGLHLDEDLVQRHLVAAGHVPGHDLGLGEALPQVGQEEVPDAGHAWRHRSTSWRIRSASGT